MPEKNQLSLPDNQCQKKSGKFTCQKKIQVSLPANQWQEKIDWMQRSKPFHLHKVSAAVR
jgi:hypothetical protein